MQAIPSFSGLCRVRAWSVHFYTSLGLVAGLLAIMAIVSDQVQNAFLFLGVALVIDATDGPLARAWQVSRWTPEFDGRKLDDITDYLNYTFIPVFFMYYYKMVTGPWMLVLPLVLLASAYGFCRKSAKTPDAFFTGFPSYWNIMVLYLYVMDSPVEVIGIVLLFLAFMVFTPIRFITSRTRQFRTLTNALQLGWLLTLFLIVANIEQVQRGLVYLSLIYPAYHTLLSFYLHFRSGSPGEGAQEVGA